MRTKYKMKTLRGRLEDKESSSSSQLIASPSPKRFQYFILRV